MRLTTKARYAVMALTDLAFLSDQDPVTLGSISQRQNLPLPYLEQLFAKLKKAGLVQSMRGVGGGYRLAKPAEDVYIYDIVSAVDRPLKATRCSHSDGNGKGCMSFGSRCATHHLWEALDQTVQGFFKRVTLADVKEKRVGHDLSGL